MATYLQNHHLQVEEFKVKDPSDPEDYGRRCRAVVTPTGVRLEAKEGAGYRPIGQAPFSSTSQARGWAQQRWNLYRELEVA